MKTLLTVTTILFLFGCANIDKAMTGANATPTNQQREMLVNKFPTLNAEQKQKFINGDPWIGMTEDQLKTMWNNEPVKAQKKLTAAGDSTIQLYQLRVGDWKTGIKSKFYKVTLTSSKVTELQELSENSSELSNF